MTEFPAVLLTLGVTLRLVGLVGRIKTGDMEVDKDRIITKELGPGGLCSNPNCDAIKSIRCQ
jgi:hypothetical protein